MTIHEVATQEQKAQLQAIADFADTKPQKYNKCRRCGGTGKVAIRSADDLRDCYGCGKYKTGHTPNKWMQIKFDAIARLEWIGFSDTDKPMQNSYNTFPHMHDQAKQAVQQTIDRLTIKAGM